MTEYDELQELEAARERNDLDVTDLREMSVAELRQVGRDLELEADSGERKDDLVDRILQRQTERAGHDYATGILDIVDEGYGFMRRHGLLPEPRRRLRQLQPGPPLRPAHRRPRRRAPSARRAKHEKYWGLLRVDSVNGVDIETAARRPRLRRPDAGPPGRADQPRDATPRTSASA